MGETSFQITAVPAALEGEEEDSFTGAKALQMSTHNKLKKNSVKQHVHSVDPIVSKDSCPACHYNWNGPTW